MKETVPFVPFFLPLSLLFNGCRYFSLPRLPFSEVEIPWMENEVREIKKRILFPPTNAIQRSR